MELLQKEAPVSRSHTVAGTHAPSTCGSLSFLSKCDHRSLGPRLWILGSRSKRQGPRPMAASHGLHRGQILPSICRCTTLQLSPSALTGAGRMPAVALPLGTLLESRRHAHCTHAWDPQRCGLRNRQQPPTDPMSSGKMRLRKKRKIFLCDSPILLHQPDHKRPVLPLVAGTQFLKELERPCHPRLSPAEQHTACCRGNMALAPKVYVFFKVRGDSRLQSSLLPSLCCVCPLNQHHFLLT